MPKQGTTHASDIADDTASPAAPDAPPPAAAKRLRPPEKVTVNLTGRSLDALDSTIELTGNSKTETINRALQVFAYLQEIWNNGGSVLVQETAKSDIERLRVF